MFFSEHFGIAPYFLREYGAVDISLVCDIPLFVDPMLIFTPLKIVMATKIFTPMGNVFQAKMIFAECFD